MTRRELIRQKADIAAKELAKRIGAAAWYDVVEQFLTTAEVAEVKDIYDAMSGSGTWASALMEWMNREPSR